MKNIKNINLLCSCIIGLGLISCGSQNKSNNAGPVTTSYDAVPITISAPSSIPVFGSSSTQTVMFVHNNTTKAINGISYSVVGGNNKKITIDTQSAGACSAIPAGGICRVGITTPSGVDQGSNLIQAVYSNPYNKANTSYKQLFQYQRTNRLDTGTPVTTSTALVAEDGKGRGSKALYYYVSGNGGVYNISANLDATSGAKIEDRTVADKQDVIGGITVFAYDVSLPVNVAKTQNSSTATFVMNVSATQAGGVTQNSQTTLNSQSTSNIALISLGLAPMVNSSGESTLVVPVMNNGGTAAENINISFLGSISTQKATNSSGKALTSSLISIINNGCTGTIPAGGGCNVEVSIPENSSGTDVLKLTYNTPGSSDVSSANTAIAWYKSASNPIIGYDYSIPTFYATQESTVTVTLTNYIPSSSTLTVQSITPVASGSSTSNVTIDLSKGSKPCASNLLSSGNSCTFEVTLKDDLERVDGNVVLLLNGSESGSASYSRYLNVSYVASSYFSELALSSNSNEFSFVGDNVATSTKLFTLTNTGPAPATLESFIVANNVTNVDKSWFDVLPGGGAEATVACENSVVLNQGDNCYFQVKMGPVSYANITAPLTESGTVPVAVTYQSGSNIESVTSLVNYSISANNQDIAISNVSVSGNASGDGSSIDPIVFSGSNTASKTVSVEYKNIGSNPITILSLNSIINPFMWTLSGDCTVGTTLQPDATCQMTYTSTVATYAATGYSGYAENTNISLTPPAIGIKDDVTGDIFVSNNDNYPAPISANTLNASMKLAKVVNMVGQTTGATEISQTVTNTNGYSSFLITQSMENYFVNPVADAGCSLSSTDNILTQTCETNGNGTFHPTLTNAPWAVGATINVNFGVTGTNGQAVLNTPTFVQSTIQ